MFGRIFVCGIFLAACLFLAAGCEENGKAVSTKETAEEKAVVIAKEPEPVKEQKTTVKLETSMGDIVIELDDKAAPITAKNFVRYVQEGFYDGLIFHRVIVGFMIQGGGFTPDMAQKPTHEPIVNEASNGLKNNRGTIAMARTNNPNSATAQFFINHKDNSFLNYAPGNPGYAVFGKVVEGMDVVDKIAAVKTGRKGPFDDVPLEAVVIKSAKVIIGGV